MLYGTFSLFLLAELVGRSCNAMTNSSKVINYDYQADSNPVSYLESGNASQALYCCGTLTASDNQTRCRDGDPFTIQDAHIQLGYALLSDVQSVPSSSMSPSPSSTDNSGTSHEAAIGAGVGVPLGVIALASLG